MTRRRGKLRKLEAWKLAHLLEVFPMGACERSPACVSRGAVKFDYGPTVKGLRGLASAGGGPGGGRR